MKSKKKDSRSIPPLRSEGVLIADAVGKANILNRQYSSVFTLEDTNNIPSKGPSKAPPIPNIKITVEGVKRMLQEFKPQKASGPDKISTRVLKELAKPLSKPLTEFFQHSIDSGVVPAQWKKAMVTPIFKKGDISTVQQNTDLSPSQQFAANSVNTSQRNPSYTIWRKTCYATISMGLGRCVPVNHS